MELKKKRLALTKPPWDPSLANPHHCVHIPASNSLQYISIKIRTSSGLL
jgi:hypothetical protein